MKSAQFRGIWCTMLSCSLLSNFMQFCLVPKHLITQEETRPYLLGSHSPDASRRAAPSLCLFWMFGVQGRA